MGQRRADHAGVHVSVENVGGIAETKVELGADVTVLAGRNATNRTSFLQALMAVLGSENVSLKGDADEGVVELRMGEETYTRTLERTSGGVRFGGDPYLEDSRDADLFAFLLESNEARQAIVRGDDLRDVLMRPIDTAEIRSEISRLESEREAVEADLDDLDDLAEELPALIDEREAVDDRLAEVEGELERARARLDEEEGSVEQSRAEQDELDDALGELSEARSDLESVRFDLQTQRESLTSLRENRARIESELDDADRPDGDVDELGAELERARDRREQLDAVVTQLQSVIGFNEEMLDGTSEEVVAALRDEDDIDDTVTDRLLTDDDVVCWTCGSAVARDGIEETLERLRSVRKRKIAERRQLREDIRETSERIEEIESRRETYEERTQRLEEIDGEIERREERVDDLTERVESLETTVADLEESTYDEVLERHREVNELEFERERLRSERDDLEAERRDVERRLDERESLEAERERIQEALVDQRTRIERIERTAVDQFNDHMADVLSRLDYRNVERIWIERLAGADGDGPSEFELHVVRTSASGSAYEDTVEHLSESEREVTGLVFALAGYLTHEVYETVPFLLLDSLEALDSARIADLLDYVDSFADRLVVALLPEDAESVDERYRRVTEI